MFRFCRAFGTSALIKSTAIRRRDITVVMRSSQVVHRRFCTAPAALFMFQLRSRNIPQLTTERFEKWVPSYSLNVVKTPGFGCVKQATFRNRHTIQEVWSLSVFLTYFCSPLLVQQSHWWRPDWSLEPLRDGHSKSAFSTAFLPTSRRWFGSQNERTV